MVWFPYLEYSHIGKEVKKFLRKYWPTIELPIPIEKIIDVKMGIHIETFPWILYNPALVYSGAVWPTRWQKHNPIL